MVRPQLCLLLFLLLATCHGFTTIIRPTRVRHIKLFQYKSSLSELARSSAAEKLARSKHDNGVMNAIFKPSVNENITPQTCPSTSFPSDFPAGALLRIGPNSNSLPEGELESYLDGDGMLHAIVIPPPSKSSSERVCTYSNRYINTLGRQQQLELQKKKNLPTLPQFKGTLVAAPRSYPMLANIFQNCLTFRTTHGQKDTCNTSVTAFGSKILALMEQGLPSEISVSKDGKIKTVLAGSNLDGALPNNNPLTGGNLGAHGRTCGKTNERFQISYAATPFANPLCRIDVFEEGFKFKRTIPVDVPVAVMTHDMAITENYCVVMDLPLTVRSERLAFDKFPVEFEADSPARIGLVPRGGTRGPIGDKPKPKFSSGNDFAASKGDPDLTSLVTRTDRETNESEDGTIWFSCLPGIVLHMGTAREMICEETGRKVAVLHGLKSLPNTPNSFILSYTAAYLYEWVLDIESGKLLREGVLNDAQLVEFPVVDNMTNGMGNCEFVYAAAVERIGGPLLSHNNPSEGVVIDGVVKFGLYGKDKGKVVGKFTLPTDEWAVSEPTIVENGYLVMCASRVSKTTDKKTGFNSMQASFLYVVSTEDMRMVSKVLLPEIMPYGLHSDFASWNVLSDV